MDIALDEGSGIPTPGGAFYGHDPFSFRGEVCSRRLHNHLVNHYSSDGNARDSRPQVGTITLETLNVFLNADFAQEADLQPRESVRLEVRDVGQGMEAAAPGRLFELFFTTKGLGTATGLGLSTVHGRVKQGGG